MSEPAIIDQPGRGLVMSHKWYLFRVRLNRETKAAEYIGEAGFLPALPKVKHKVRGNRFCRHKTMERSYPGIKNYILVGFGLEQPTEFRQVMDLPFMGSPVGLGNFACRLKAEHVYDFLTHGAWDKTSVKKLVTDWEPDYCEGDTVQLKGSAFGGFISLAHRINAEKRTVLVTVPFLGSEREVELPADEVYKIEPVKAA